MSSFQSASLVFSTWSAANRSCEWDVAESLLAPDVIVNGASTTGHAYIQKLRDEKFESSILDICIVDDEKPEIAARFLVPNSTEPISEGEEWTQQNLYTVANGKISVIQELTGTNNIADPISKPGSQAKTTGATTLGATELRRFYTEYIDSINTLTMADHFDRFCHDSVTHNYHSYGRDEYREMIESSFEDISGLHFTIEGLIVNEESQRLAARLGFTGVPTQEFRGIPPTGRAVKFSEHAFYQIQDGRITQVWSLLDLAAYQASMGA